MSGIGRLRSRSNSRSSPSEANQCSLLRLRSLGGGEWVLARFVLLCGRGTAARMSSVPKHSKESTSSMSKHTPPHDLSVQSKLVRGVPQRVSITRVCYCCRHSYYEGGWKDLDFFLGFFLSVKDPS